VAEINEFQWTARDVGDTDRLGNALAELLPPGTTVALVGTLGAGKTRLVQSVAANLGVPREAVTSPTFVICQEYDGTRKVYHFDAYRLAGEDDLFDLGPEEYFESDAITFIEWADRVRGCLPSDHVEIDISVDGETGRTFQIASVGMRYGSVVRAVHDRLQRQENQ
jgi:tRNA threonylcarbamoyladenosine biosynthesis protein TsaE